MSRCVRWSKGLAAVWAATALTASAGFLDHNFDAAPFTNGAVFTTVVSNWAASSASVMVSNGYAFSAPQAVVLPGPSALSNAVAQLAPSVVWTDLRLAPGLGEADPTVASNGLSFHGYFGTNGYLHLGSGGTWLVCSNDAWGAAVPRVTNGVYATLSVYQNFTAQRAAVLLNDQVVVQDLPFPGSNTAYNTLSLLNADATAWLDDAYVQPSYATNRLFLDRNLDGLADARELQDYGYVARTFVVGEPLYPTLAAALLVARDRDTISIPCSPPLNATVTFTQSVILAGCTFTNSGTLTVAAGRTVTVAEGFTGSLIVNGTLALAAGVVVSGAVVTVTGTGTITVPTNALLLAGRLDLQSSGTVVATGGMVTETGTGLTLAGVFTLGSDGNWPAVAGLDFIDDFESYTNGTRLQHLGLEGWGASTSSVQVKVAEGYGPTQGVLLPGLGLVSNRIATSQSQTKVWTDFFLRATGGEPRETAATNTGAFVGYLASNGLLNIWAAGGWAACSSYVNGSNVMAVAPGDYLHVTTFLDYSEGTNRAAVFVDGKLVREQLGFPGGASVPGYRSFQVLNTDGNAGLDEVRITAGWPTNLTADLDQDARPDAYEIDTYGTLAVWQGPRTIFRFR